MARVTQSSREQLEGILSELRNIGNMTGTAIVSRDGLLIADALPKNIDAEIFSSMTATMHGAAETAVKELKVGICKTSIAESDKNTVLVTGVSPVFLLVALAEKSANLGLVRVEMNKAAAKIKELL